MNDPNESAPMPAGSWSSQDEQARMERLSQKAKAARKVVDLIDREGHQFWQGQGHQELRDVTAERRAEKLAEAEMLEEIVQKSGRLL